MTAEIKWYMVLDWFEWDGDWFAPRDLLETDDPLPPQVAGKLLELDPLEGPPPGYELGFRRVE